MERKSIILETRVDFEGQSYAASYFVDTDGIIHANIGGKVMLAPTALLPAESVVKSLLTGHILQHSRKERLAEDWFGYGR